MSKKVVVIGGGVAGLSAGIYAALNSFDTVILEMHTVAGGQCNAWGWKGYRFDYCLAGKWLFPGGGLPPSAQTGKWAVQLICKKEKQKFVPSKIV